MIVKNDVMSVSILDSGYTVKYNPLPSGISLSFALGKQRVIFEGISLVSSLYGYNIYCTPYTLKYTVYIVDCRRYTVEYKLQAPYSDTNENQGTIAIEGPCACTSWEFLHSFLVQNYIKIIRKRPSLFKLLYCWKKKHKPTKWCYMSQYDF